MKTLEELHEPSEGKRQPSLEKPHSGAWVTKIDLDRVKLDWKCRCGHSLRVHQSTNRGWEIGRCRAANNITIPEDFCHCPQWNGEELPPPRIAALDALCSSCGHKAFTHKRFKDKPDEPTEPPRYGACRGKFTVKTEDETHQVRCPCADLTEGQSRFTLEEFSKSMKMKEAAVRALLTAWGLKIARDGTLIEDAKFNQLRLKLTRLLASGFSDVNLP